jgi:hypothetical protein
MQPRVWLMEIKALFMEITAAVALYFELVAADKAKNIFHITFSLSLYVF